MRSDSKGILTWPVNERPRERLLRLGPQALTEPELLAILLEDALLSVGIVDQARPAIRTLVAKALQANASAVILGHNHPSGAAEASESDRMFTSDVLAALHPIGVRLLDHVIVGADATFSFAKSGLMAELTLTCQTPNCRS